MLTRCPHCDTAFRVTPEQLKARQGRVRCGQCQSVFNALETLVEEAPAAQVADIREPEPEPVPAELPAGPMPAAATTEAAVAEAGTEQPAQAGEIPQPPAAGAEETAAAETGAEAVVIPEPDPAEAPTTEPESPPDTMLTPPLATEPLLHEEPPRRRRAWPWALGILAALLALALQALFAFRVELAVVVPELKPLLVSLCDLAGCQVGLPRKIELVGIETSDLHPDPARPGRLQLDAGLRNRAPFVQTWPHLELTLTDTADQALIRRVLAPAEYLPERLDPAAGIPANGEQAIHLDLETAGVSAVGYRLYIFYP